MHHLLVCAGCHGADRAQGLIDRLAAALPGFQVGATGCMSGCTRPATLAFRADGKASYLFGDIDPEAAIGDIIAFAHSYAGKPDGWVTDATGFGTLRHGAIARIPVAPGR